MPINVALRANSEGGNPMANFTGEPKLGKELDTVIRRLAGQVSLHDRAKRPLRQTD